MKPILSVVLIYLLIWFASCDKEPDQPENNPFANITPPDTTQQVTPVILPDSSLAWLHARVFLPTCANSGCHDGTFEPDYRTINSTYHTLVNQPAIKTDPSVTLATKRVVPFKPDSSMLYFRLTQILPNTTGLMPAVANGSDWEENKELYLQKIRTWIQIGAPNVTP